MALIDMPAHRRLTGWRPRCVSACLQALLALVGPALAGCATSPDPRDGGFVSGVVGLAGGGYQRRIDERETSYRGELDAQQRLQAEARALQQERAEVQAELQQANARLAALEQRIARQRVALQAQRRQADLRRLEQAQARVASTRGTLQGVRPDEQPVTDLRARSQAIQRDLDEIDRLVAVVGGGAF
ncbi:MAG: hypothetical protein EA400_06980 [Chromatiaceae bacterium]|nr:MAG: hypothetical protein EA400_06980 [Chromatiaceae bacterium]